MEGVTYLDPALVVRRKPSTRSEKNVLYVKDVGKTPQKRCISMDDINKDSKQARKHYLTVEGIDFADGKNVANTKGKRRESKGDNKGHGRHSKRPSTTYVKPAKIDNTDFITCTESKPLFTTCGKEDCVDGPIVSETEPTTRRVVISTYDGESDREVMEGDEVEETSLLLHNERNGRTYEAVDGGMDNVSMVKREILSTEELIYQMRFAFINKGFEVDANVERTRDTIEPTEQTEFRENILEILPECPIPMSQKLKICRSLRVSRSRRYKDKNSMRYVTNKKSKEYSKLIFMLWEGMISRLSAYFGSNVASYFYFLRFLLYLNFLVSVLVVCFVTLPQILSGETFVNTHAGHFGDLSDSLMFYGVYTDGFIGDYNEPLAYLVTWAVVSLLSLVIIVISMQVRYRRSKLMDSEKNYEFAWRTFCSWDHSVTSKDGVKDRLKAICTEMRERIREEKKLAKGSIWFNIAVFIGRLVSNLIVLALLVGSGMAIFYVADAKYDFPEAFDNIENFFKRYQLSAVVAVLKLVVPQIFRLLTSVEGLKPRTEQKLLMTRTVVFYFASLSVFIVSLYNVAIGCVDNSEHAPNTTDNANMTQNRSYCCWENQVGEEVFKVVLIDFGLLLTVGIFFHIIRAVLVSFGLCCKMVKHSQFDVPSSVLDLIYGQGLVWLGLYFSPLLVVAGFIKLVIVFYFKFFVAKTAMLPPSHLFKASRSGNFYLFLLVLTWFLCLLPIAYAIAELPSSWDCGPFSNNEYAYELITGYIGQSPRWLEEALYYIGTPIIEIPVIIFLILLALFYKARSSSYEALVKELRNQLTIERKVERRKVFARAISAPLGSVGKVSGSAMSLAPGSLGRSSASSLGIGYSASNPNLRKHASNMTLRDEVLKEEDGTP